MPPKLGGKWGTECLNTRFPLPTLLCARLFIYIFAHLFKLFNRVYCKNEKNIILSFLILFLLFIKKGPIEASRGAATRRVTAKSTGCGFDPHSRRWNIYLNLYFHFLRFGVEVKRGVEFCPSTRNASRIRQKVGNGVS